ncbi:MAG: glycosyltransferase family 4 protein [Planctomycetaceae bacterium]
MRGLFLVQSLAAAATRYRALQYLPYLRAEGMRCDVEEVAATFGDRWRQFARAADYDFVFLQRKLLTAFWWWRLRRTARKIVFDFDDAIMFRSSSRRDPHSRGRMRAFARTVRGADLVLCGNRFLLEQCQAATGNRPSRAAIVPTVVDADRYAPHVARAAAPGDDRVTLVWIGSRSTLPYLESLRPALEELGRTHPQVGLKVICDTFPEFARLPVIRVPWSEATEAAEVATCDIGLMPLSDDLWSRGKCGLKILQYQAAALPCVASPVGVNRELIQEGVTGFTATTAAEWLANIERLIDDPAARHRMGAAARERVVDGWSLAAWHPRVLELLRGMEMRGIPSEAA